MAYKALILFCTRKAAYFARFTLRRLHQVLSFILRPFFSWSQALCCTASVIELQEEERRTRLCELVRVARCRWKKEDCVVNSCQGSFQEGRVDDQPEKEFLVEKMWSLDDEMVYFVCLFRVCNVFDLCCSVRKSFRRVSWVRCGFYVSSCHVYCFL